MTAKKASCGVVVIGRNEGERLRRCLDSVQSIVPFVVYVDSGSTDGSVELARAKGADAVRLDMTTPFTAARARNAGFKRLQQRDQELRYVQFVDGDCELFDDWLPAAASFLDEHAGVACVCGRLRERFPERSVYNRLCDYEWDRPAGEADSCGGIAMMRCGAFSSLGGFREDLVAGEEPELCRRLRHEGWKVWRLAREMAWHDAAMLRFGQWWKRSTRVGFAYAQAVWMHGKASEPREWRQLLTSWIWVAAVPLTMVAAWLVWGPLAALLALVYPLQVIRLASMLKGEWRARLTRGVFLLLGRFPECLGQSQFWRGAMRGSTSGVSFDYKN